MFGSHQPLPRLDVGDVHLLQTGQLALGRVCRRLDRPLADAVQSSGLKHTRHRNHRLFHLRVGKESNSSRLPIGVAMEDYAP